MKDLNGFGGLYSITEGGEIFSHRSNRFISISQKSNGYVYTELNKFGKTSYHRVHRLVALTYIDNPENKPFVNHIDGTKNNNHYTNLEWVTGRENNLHAIETGLVTLCDKWDVYLKGSFVGTYTGYKEIIETFGIAKNTIYNSIKNQKPTRSGYEIIRSYE
jgi:hypothetical protein